MQNMLGFLYFLEKNPYKLLPGPPTLRRAFFMIASTSSQNISISPVIGAEVSLGF